MNITKSKNMNKSKHNKTHRKTDTKPLLNQTIQRIETQQKHPAHPLPNQTIIKEILNTIAN